MRPRPVNPKTLKTILDAVADKFGVAPGDFARQDRSQPLATARQVAAYLLRRHSDGSLTEISRAFRRDGASWTCHCVREISDRVRIEPALLAKVMQLDAEIDAAALEDSRRLTLKTAAA